MGEEKPLDPHGRCEEFILALKNKQKKHNDSISLSLLQREPDTHKKKKLRGGNDDGYMTHGGIGTPTAHNIIQLP